MIMVSIYEALGEELDTNRLFGAMTVLIIAHNMGTRIFAIVFHFFALIRASSKRLSAILLLTETKETRIIE